VALSFIISGDIPSPSESQETHISSFIVQWNVVSDDRPHNQSLRAKVSSHAHAHKHFTALWISSGTN